MHAPAPNDMQTWWLLLHSMLEYAVENGGLACVQVYLCNVCPMPLFFSSCPLLVCAFVHCLSAGSSTSK